MQSEQLGQILSPVEKLPTKLINFLNFFPANKIQIEAKI
jgi:hypothetical protein